jgi:hypothetical protein
MLQEAPINPNDSKTRKIKSKWRCTRERNTNVLLLVASLTEDDERRWELWKDYLFPLYISGKGGQQYICGHKFLQATYKVKCSLTRVERYTPRAHMSSSKVVCKSKAPMQGHSMRYVKHFSFKPLMTPTILISHVLHWVHSP